MAKYGQKAQETNPKPPLWDLEIGELEGKNLERKGRDEVNDMLSQGWVLLHIYTLRFKDDSETWRERPMAILGWPKSQKRRKTEGKRYADVIVH